MRTKLETDAAGARGLEIYESVIAPQLTDDDRGRYVAIDVETGEWEIDDDEEVTETLRARVPGADIFLLRHIYIDIGHLRPPRGLLKSIGVPNTIEETLG